jgi:hypothetical protein
VCWNITCSEAYRHASSCRVMCCVCACLSAEPGRQQAPWPGQVRVLCSTFAGWTLQLLMGPTLLQHWRTCSTANYRIMGRGAGTHEQLCASHKLVCH